MAEQVLHVADVVTPGLAKMDWVTFAVEKDEAFDPGQVALFCAVGVVLATQHLACAIEQFSRRHENPLLKAELQML